MAESIAFGLILQNYPLEELGPPWFLSNHTENGSPWAGPQHIGAHVYVSGHGSLQVTVDAEVS